MNDRLTAFERHGTAVLQAIIVALLVWVGKSTVDVRESVVKLQTQMSEVVLRRMDGQDAVINDHEQRIRALERR
jgi:hypothetical protein